MKKAYVNEPASQRPAVESNRNKHTPPAIHTQLPSEPTGNPYIALCYRGSHIVTYSTSPTIFAASLYVASSFSHFSRSALIVSSS